jgi:hypothetical protein
LAGALRDVDEMPCRREGLYKQVAAGMTEKLHLCGLRACHVPPATLRIDPMRGDLALVLQAPALLAVTARTAYVLARDWSRARERRVSIARLVEGLCPACGYDLRESPARCPECGTPVAGEGADRVRQPRPFHAARIMPRRMSASR